MRTFIIDAFPKIERFSKKLNDLTTLTNKHWILVNNISTNKTLYIFRPNNELLISINGKIEKGKWEYIGINSLVIEMQKQSYLFKHGFIDGNILALKLDSTQEYAIFVDENKYNEHLNTIDKVLACLNSNYIESINVDKSSNKVKVSAQHRNIKRNITNDKIDKIIQWSFEKFFLIVILISVVLFVKFLIDNYK